MPLELGDFDAILLWLSARLGFVYIDGHEYITDAMLLPLFQGDSESGLKWANHRPSYRAPQPCIDGVHETRFLL